jgi:hypothetical protein
VEAYELRTQERRNKSVEGAAELMKSAEGIEQSESGGCGGEVSWFSRGIW